MLFIRVYFRFIYLNNNGGKWTCACVVYVDKIVIINL